MAVDGERVTFDDSAQANVAVADAFARIRALLDDVIRRSGRDVPTAAEPDDADTPALLDPPRTLDLRAGVGSVVWSTGYTGDYSLLDPGLTDVEGLPRRDGVAGAAPGLFYVGLRWLTRRSSGNFLGFPADAATVATAVAATLRRHPRQLSIRSAAVRVGDERPAPDRLRPGGPT